jgi:hypothetical protein
LMHGTSIIPINRTVEYPMMATYLLKPSKCEIMRTVSTSAFWELFGLCLMWSSPAFSQRIRHLHYVGVEHLLALASCFWPTLTGNSSRTSLKRCSSKLFLQIFSLMLLLMIMGLATRSWMAST